MQLPKFVYEPLPVAYVATGLATALTHPEPLPFVSGIALASGGLMILVLRRNHRLRRRRRHPASHRRLVGDTLGA